MRPSVTVLITLKNSKDTIKRCIDSILNLKYPNYKIYVVDAFSDDGSFEILKSYGKKIKLEQLKGNPPTAYNHAIDKIKTEFIAFTNADCIVDKNWLREIIKPFKDKNVMAVAGFVTNPKKLESKLQELIGRELEDRYKHFPKEVTRAPEMNLCVRTKIMKKLKFNNFLDVSYDADFCNRLIKKYKKIKYQKSAIISHYHRATWKSFFKQQFTYTKFIPEVYLKYKSGAKGDFISKPIMIIQPFIFLSFIITLIFSLFNSTFLFVSLFFIITLFILYIIDIARLSKNLTDVLIYFGLFFIRTIAWVCGILNYIIINRRRIERIKRKRVMIK